MFEKSQRYRLALSALCVSLSVGLFVYSGTVDSFAPFQIAMINQVADTGTLTQAHSRTIPAFYAFGAILMQATGIPSQQFLTLPIQMFPMFVVLFVLVYRLSDSIWFATALVIVQMFVGAVGTQRYFLWPHGIGRILGYLAVFLLAKLYDSSKQTFKSYSLVLLLIGIATIGISYNYTMTYVISLIALFIGMILVDMRSNGQTIDRRKFTGTVRLGLMVAVVLFGLYPFLYEVYLPLIATSDPPISAVERFMSSYFSGGSGSLPDAISTMYLSRPPEITYLSLVKYLVVGTVLSVFSLDLLQGYRNGRDVSGLTLSLFAFIVAISVFVLARIPIGDIAVDLLYYPGIFCLAWLYRRRPSFNVRSYRKLALVGVLILMVVTPAQLAINYQHDLVDKSESNYDYIQEPAEWHANYVTGSTYSDELTRGLILLHGTEHEGKDLTAYDRQLRLLSSDDVGGLIQSTNDSLSGDYYVLNNRLDTLGIQNWIGLKPWTVVNEELQSNDGISRVYDSGSVSVYRNAQQTQ